MNPIEQIRNSALASYAETLKRLLKPAIAMVHAPVDSPAPIGASKLGGEPNLPPDFEWPEWQGTPLAFLAQVNLEQVAPYDAERLLPPSGMLYFFYEAHEQPWGYYPDDAGSWRVVYYAGRADTLVHTPLPRAMPKDCRFPEVPIAFEQRSMLPLDFEELELLAPELELTDERWDEYAELAYRIAQIEEDQPKNWLLGYHASIQGAASADAIRAQYAMSWQEALARGQELILLLHLDSDETIEMVWGDVGTLYFWIHRDDLAARRFDKVWMILQCY